MKKAVSLILCILFLSMLCACDKTEKIPASTESTPDSEVSQDISYDGLSIVGTWVCEKISDDVYFIFDEYGDAYAKWGTSTVYGYYDYYEDENLYDIDVPNFLYNEYEAHFGGDVMTLKSEESSFTFKKATMPEVIIKTPDNLAIDNGIIGNWQSADNYECYEFRSDGTAVVTDLYNFSTVDCKFSCNDGVITMYYMASDTKEGSRQLEYSFTNDGKLVIAGYTYESVTAQN
ncbi:MAG: hypothetical protein IJE16_08600 [Ruminococcus sp.]|nr:hypothetical protein [Ruminococcus sp.]